MINKEVLYSLDDNDYVEEGESSVFYRKYKEFSSTMGCMIWVIIFAFLIIDVLFEGTKHMKTADNYMGNTFTYVFGAIILIWGYNRLFSWINLKNKRKRCNVTVCAQIMPLRCVKDVKGTNEIFNYTLGYIYEINGVTYKLKRNTMSMYPDAFDNASINMNVNPNMPNEILIDKEHNFTLSAVWGIIGGVLALSVTLGLIVELEAVIEKVLLKFL